VADRCGSLYIGLSRSPERPFRRTPGVGSRGRAVARTARAPEGQEGNLACIDTNNDFGTWRILQAVPGVSSRAVIEDGAPGPNPAWHSGERPHFGGAVDHTLLRRGANCLGFWRLMAWRWNDSLLVLLVHRAGARLARQKPRKNRP